MCARAIFLLNSLLATTCVTGISLKPLSLSEAPTVALEKSPEEAVTRGGEADADAQTEDTEDTADMGNKDEGAADNAPADDAPADDAQADNKKADDDTSTPEADDASANDTSTPEAPQALPPVPDPVDDGNSTDDSDNRTLTELLDQITPGTIYLGVGQKIQDAYQEVSKAVQKFEQLDHFIMGDFEKKLEDIKGHYVRIYNKVQKKVKAIQTEVKQAKDYIQQDPDKKIPEFHPQLGR